MIINEVKLSNKLSKIIYDLMDHIKRSLWEAHGKELPLERPKILAGRKSLVL